MGGRRVLLGLGPQTSRGVPFRGTQLTAGYVPGGWDPTHGAHGASLLRALLLAVLFLSPLGPMVTIGLQGKYLGLTAAMLVAPVMYAHMAVSGLMPRVLRPEEWRWLGLVVLTMLVGVVSAPALIPAMGVAYSFTVGLLVGFPLGAYLRADLRSPRWTALDTGLAVFTWVTTAQIAFAVAGAPAVSDFHEYATLPWGGSNYVAGVLAVVSTLVLARSVSRRGFGRLACLATALVGAAGVGLTFSRGGILALSVGFFVVLVLSLRRGSARLLGLVAGAGVVWAGLAVVDAVVEIRLQRDGQVAENFDSRVVIWEAAWRAFLEHPLFGTGWYGLRALDVGGALAHNVVLSFLQVAGVFGVPAICAIVHFSSVAVRSRAVSLAPIAATVTIALSDPFFEGGIGGIIGWSVLVAGAYGIQGGSTGRAGRPDKVVRFRTSQVGGRPNGMKVSELR